MALYTVYGQEIRLYISLAVSAASLAWWVGRRLSCLEASIAQLHANLRAVDRRVDLHAEKLSEITQLKREQQESVSLHQERLSVIESRLEMVTSRMLNELVPFLRRIEQKGD